jgi:hypothetical protein
VKVQQGAMLFDPGLYAAHFPLAQLGGVFVAVVGISILLGSLWPRARMNFVWFGLPLAALAVAIAFPAAPALPAPSSIQIAALVLAIGFEVAAFILVLPLAGARGGERAVVIATLAIVGAHFTIMLPVFGPLIAIIGLACLANAALAAAAVGYGERAAWFVDGVIKVSGGLAMASPALGIFAG